MMQIPLYNERIVEVLVKEESVQEKMVEMTRQVAIEVMHTNIYVPMSMCIHLQVYIQTYIYMYIHIYFLHIKICENIYIHL